VAHSLTTDYAKIIVIEHLLLNLLYTRKPSYRWQTRDAKACQKLLQFDVLTSLSLTILA